jgi:serine/threonine-protein kinase SRPK3
MESQEHETPSARKVVDGHTIYATPNVLIPKDLLRPVLCDFGEARPGDTPEPIYEDIQPLEYRAPEAILDMPISYASDIWNAGLLVRFSSRILHIDA